MNVNSTLRTNRIITPAAATLALLVSIAGCTTGPERSAQSAAARAEALLSRMTLDEKIGQMTQVDLMALNGRASDVQTYFLGSVLSGGGSDPADISPQGWLGAVEQFQSWAAKTRLQIPLLYGIDAVHGHNNVDGAVIFPHNIGLGATRNPELVEKAARVTARELAGTGIRWTFAPCVAVAIDERWGRTYESFGDSPDLVSELGAAAVRGFQGRRLSSPTSVLACAKHFVADGGTQGGVDQGNTVCDEATLRRIHLAPYVDAIEAGAKSVMVSYSSWNGAKMHGHKELITGVLKGELGFSGFVVSDWAAIDQLPGDYRQDIETSINAGLDMIMIPNGPGQPNNYVQFITLLKELVEAKRVSMDRIDDAVRRILTVKFQMGVFENRTVDPAWTASIGSQEHREAARECVRASLVLLKNERNALPLSRQLKRLHVAGAAADDLGVQCGGWTIDWQGKPGPVTKGGTTILAALKKAVGSGTEITYSRDGSGAQGADAVIVVIGEQPYAEMRGDRQDLRVSAGDLAIIERARASGAPVATVLLSGRPLILGAALDTSDALVAAWLPGTEGMGVADVLSGRHKPVGKLPCVWPATNEQVGRDLRADEKPQFPFGYGLTF